MLSRNRRTSLIFWLLVSLVQNLKLSCGQEFCALNGPCQNDKESGGPPQSSVSRGAACPVSDCDGSGVLQHHLGDDGIGRSVACLIQTPTQNYTDANAYLRCFSSSLCETDRIIDSVYFRVQSLKGSAITLEINLFKGSSDGCDSTGDVRVLYQQTAALTTTVTLQPQSGDFPVTFPIPAANAPFLLSSDESLLVEIRAPAMGNVGEFFMDDSDDIDQCDPSYLQTNTCGNTTEPFPVSSLTNFPRVSFIIAVNTSPVGSMAPSEEPSLDPSEAPSFSVQPSEEPAPAPSEAPSFSVQPSSEPSKLPSAAPVPSPPTFAPTPAANPPSGGIPVPAPPELCFSDCDVVIVRGKGEISIDRVRVGDYVLTSNGHFSRVFSLAHFHNDLDATFIQIHTAAAEESSFQPLEISSDHLLFVNGTATRASRVEVGDWLGDDDTTAVTNITTVQRRGVFAPLTEAGELVVNGVRVSSYVDVLPTAIWNQHHLGQLLFGPLRMICRWNFGYCESEQYDEVTGYSELYLWLIRLLIGIRKSGALVSLVVTAAVAPVLMGLWTLEQLLLSSASVLWSTALVVVVTSWLMLLAIRRRSHSQRKTRSSLRNLLSSTSAKHNRT